LGRGRLKRRRVGRRISVADENSKRKSKSKQVKKEWRIREEEKKYVNEKGRGKRRRKLMKCTKTMRTRITKAKGRNHKQLHNRPAGGHVTCWPGGGHVTGVGLEVGM